MTTFNKVILVGHLGNDPILRTLENELKVVDFSIATHEVSGPDRVEITDWHEVVAWRKLAGFSEKFLKKGNKVMIEGRLKTSSWLDKETGKQRRSVFVLADQIRFMDKLVDKRSEKPGILSEVAIGDGKGEGLGADLSAELDEDEELF